MTTLPAATLPAATLPGEVPASVAAVLAALDGVADRPLDEHVDVFDAVHRGLQDALAGLDEH